MSTDSEIIERSLKDAESFAGIFERHVRPVGAYIRRRLGGESVEDVLSETFLVAFRRRESFDLSVDSALPWLLGIATRLIRSQRAAEARHWRSFEASAGAAAVEPEPALAEAERRMDATAALRELAPRIAALAQRDRDTLLLHAWAGLTYEQTAAALGVPIGTVRSRLNRVRRRLAPAGSQAAARLTWMAKVEG